MATPKKPNKHVLLLPMGFIHVAEAAHNLRFNLDGRKKCLLEFVESRDPEAYNGLESAESRIAFLAWEVEERLLALRVTNPRADIIDNFSSDVLEALIDECYDNDQKIVEASGECAELLAKDEAINTKLETLLLGAFDELQQYVR